MVEAAAALGQLLGIDDQVDVESVSDHSPAVAAVFVVVEFAAGFVCGPANDRWILFLRIAVESNCGGEAETENQREFAGKEHCVKCIARQGARENVLD